MLFLLPHTETANSACMRSAAHQTSRIVDQNPLSLLVTEDSPKDGGKNAFLQPLFHFVSGLSSNSEMKVEILVTKCGVDFGVEKAGEQTLEVIGSINALSISGNKHNFV